MGENEIMGNRIENMEKNLFSEDQIRIKENLDERLAKGIVPGEDAEELNEYLKMLSDMNNIGVLRKLILLEGYINKVKNKLKSQKS